MIGFPNSTDDEDREIKRRKNEEYRAFLQLQIEEKERRLEAEKREINQHPLGPQYENPSLPFRRKVEAPAFLNEKCSPNPNNFNKVNSQAKTLFSINESQANYLQITHAENKENPLDIQKSGQPNKTYEEHREINLNASRKNNSDSKPKIWHKSDELPDKQTLEDLHKTVLRRQIDEKRREREEQKKKEEEEDAKLELKIQQYNEEIRRREEESRKKQLAIAKRKINRSIVEILEPKNTRRVQRQFEPDSHLPKLKTIKPSTPSVEKYDPEITLAAKLNKTGVGDHDGKGTHRLYASNANDEVHRSTDKTLPSIGPAFIYPQIRRSLSPPVPAVYWKTFLEYEKLPTTLEILQNIERFEEFRDYQTRERAVAEQNLWKNLNEESHGTHKKAQTNNYYENLL